MSTHVSGTASLVHNLPATAEPTHRGMHSLKNNRRQNDNEPLLRFREAKKVLGEVYGELKDNVAELEHVYGEIKEENIVSREQKEEVEAIRDSIKTIMDTFQRDNMKVVFFGRTSNGKSTTINAMLHAKVLPQGMGHTTCCFLQVQGCEDNEGYLQLDDNPQRIPMDKLGKLGHAQSNQNSDLPAMGQDSLLRIFHPKQTEVGENRLLQNDVVILDSPGVDLSPEFDSWIDKHCLDADVFVLVSNAESTLTQAEKNFFHRVAKKLSKPNVFILNNRWDASASEMDNIDDVKKQHLTRFRGFLVDELEVCSEREVNDRIFFVSSREVLEARLKARGVVQKAYQAEGHGTRALEFASFEKHFEHCISRSAIHTKFEAHNRRAHEMIGKMRLNLNSVLTSAAEQRSLLQNQLNEATNNFNECRVNFSQFEKAYREQTERLRAEVHLKVSADFFEEIARLDAIVDRFDEPFDSSSAGMIKYKQELAVFVDKCLSSDLEARCTGGLMSRIWNLENDMFQYVTKILAEPYQNKLEEVWRYRAPFKFSICVDVPALVNDFHEDLEFRFTFGLHAMIRRIIAYRSGQPVTSINSNLLTPLSLRKENKNVIRDEAVGVAAEEQAMMTQMVLTSAAFLANGSIGVLVVGGIVYKAVGWRVIAVGGAAYAGLYAWERMRWSSGAKEQHLKEQFRSHLAARMQHVAAAHTTHCETQAMREMDQVFDGLRATVGGVHREMKAELDEQKQAIDAVDVTIRTLGTIKYGIFAASVYSLWIDSEGGTYFGITTYFKQTFEKICLQMRASVGAVQTFDCIPTFKSLGLLKRGKAVFLLRNLEQFASSYLRSDSPTSP